MMIYIYYIIVIACCYILLLFEKHSCGCVTLLTLPLTDGTTSTDCYLICTKKYSTHTYNYLLRPPPLYTHH